VFVAAFGILGTQLGIALSYVVVIIETLREPTLLGARCSALTLRLAVGGALCCFCLLRRLNGLAKLSGAALLIYAYLLGALLFFGCPRLVSGEVPGEAAAWLPVRWGGVGPFLGTAIFSMEAIVLCQYVYDDMRLSERRRFLPVLVSSFGISGGLFAFVGAFGVLSYGDELRNIFYLNFPAGGPAVVIGELVLCTVLMLSFALHMYPIMTFLEATLLGVRPGDASCAGGAEAAADAQPGCSGGGDAESGEPHKAGQPASAWARCAVLSLAVVLRCAAVAAVCTAAAMVPNLACVTGYTGGFAMSSVSFFMPALCHVKLLGGRLSPAQWLGDASLVAAGCAAVGLGLANTSC